MDVISTAQAMMALRHRWKLTDPNTMIALVPTMGALHEGHACLVRLARTQASKVVVSIFVNPLQFGANEDLSHYPRPKGADLALCESLGVDAVYYPAVDDVYPNGMGDVTRVVPPEALVNQLCGTARPGHFTGVATVVLILLNRVMPDIAVFGEKDAQQVMVIRRMVSDLGLPVKLLIHPVVREASGLALSSRNQYLKTPEQRKAALLLSQTLLLIQERVQNAPGKTLPVEATLENCVKEAVRGWQREADRDKVNWRLQYLEARNEDTLQPCDTLSTGVRLFIAAYVDEVRLIDTLLIY